MRETVVGGLGAKPSDTENHEKPCFLRDVYSEKKKVLPETRCFVLGYFGCFLGTELSFSNCFAEKPSKLLSVPQTSFVWEEMPRCVARRGPTGGGARSLGPQIEGNVVFRVDWNKKLPFFPVKHE